MAPSIIQELTDRFERNEQAYSAPQYNETQTRLEFIDPFFEALGWDIHNRSGKAEAYKDVVHEDAIKIAGATKAPDYSFRIGGRRIFFLEAKKPAVNVREDASPAFQLRRYAWSSKLPLSILTNFAELAVYDCRIKPAQIDKASTARVLHLRYGEYAAHWEEIASIFSRESVERGSFDRYAAATRLKRGTAEVDQAFLAEIEAWREVLARNFALRNEALSERELNFAVERTIDRIIFLRMCEDRGIEEYGQLAAIANGEGTYRRICEVFQRADERYNSGLFHFDLEKGRNEPPDELTPELALDDKPLEGILRSLYYPDSPYEFSVLPAEILGEVYEQFLGKVIALTKGHRASVAPRPDVKKAGGVYYTPSYIVNYIVRGTLGRLLEGKTPRQAAKLRVLDPACGSGSFLVGAYSFLLDWHRDRYVEDGPKKRSKEVYRGPGGLWHLTTAEKKRILLNNIFGVDIDTQAVEVTKLSLLLKVLEGENRESLERQRRFLHERALPDLGANIKCGNSLIGPDYFNGRQTTFLDDDARYRINAFDWRAEFPEVFGDKGGGFDCAIGNPPYLFITEVPVDMRRYFESAFSTIAYRFDLYGAFIERAVRLLLCPDGVLGFIIPHTLLSNDSFSKLRSLLARDTTVQQVVDLGPGVFSTAKNETMLLFLRNARPTAKSAVSVVQSSARRFRLGERDAEFTALQRSWMPTTGAPWLVRVDPAAQSILDKIDAHPVHVGELCTINQGLRTGDNEKFLSSRQRGRRWKPAAGGKQIGRYQQIAKELFVLYDPALLDAPRREELFDTAEKIVVQEIRNITLRRRIEATLDTDRFYCLQSTNVINRRKGCDREIRYILGCLNSAAVNYYFRSRFPGNNHIPSNQLARIPIPVPSHPDESKMAKLVDEVLSVQAKLATTRTPHAITALRRQIAMADARIERLANELYGLSQEEIALIGAADEA